LKLFFSNILKGIIIGIANIIPGLSGATLALILGIYRKSINIITKFDLKLLKLITSLEINKAREYISLNFILAITIGIIISFIVMSNLLTLLLINYSTYTWSYFFGIILVSIPYIAQHTSRWTKIESLFFLIGLLSSVVLIFIEPRQENSNLFFVFICGMIGGIGMLIPGLSGSYLLILLGNYQLLLVTTIKKISSILYSSQLIQNFIDNLYYFQLFIIFMLGQLCSVILFSRIIKYLINKQKNAIFSILSGFIAGSLIYIWPWKKNIEVNKLNKLIYYLDYPHFDNKHDIYLILFIGLGIITIILIEKWAKNKKNV